jgi:hypothetical protein
LGASGAGVSGSGFFLVLATFGARLFWFEVDSVPIRISGSFNVCYRTDRDDIPRPTFWEDIAMKASSLFVTSPVVTILSIALLCALGGTAKTATPSGGATGLLPNVVVEAPQKPKQRAVARSAVSPRTSPTAATPSASPTAQLAKLEKATGSCVGGCVTSFRSGDRPWVGCSGSSGMLSSTCRNTGNYKTFAECTEAGLITGWKAPEVSWYCSSLALK